MQTAPPAAAVCTNSQPPSVTAPEPLTDLVAEVQDGVEVMEEQTQEEEALPSHVAVADPLKLSLFRLSAFKQDTEKAYPNFTVEVKDDGVYITGTDRQKMEQIKRTVLDYFAKIADSHLILEVENANFLAREDVKKHLVQKMNQSGFSSTYTVSGCNVVVTSLTQNSADQACSFLKSQLCHFSIPVTAEYECMLYCREWTEFLQKLNLTSAKVSERGDIDVFTLKEMESEKKTAIQKFLSTPIDRETVIPMEPGMLKYIQNHHHQLLADMDQVSIFPLEVEDVCGLKVCVALKVPYYTKSTFIWVIN